MLTRLGIGSEARGLACSFCGQGADSVARLVGGPGVQICDGCVALAARVLDGATEGAAPGDLGSDALLSRLPVTEAGIDGMRGVLRAQVGELRARGVSWTAIGGALGITRQAAWERFS